METNIQTKTRMNVPTLQSSLLSLHENKTERKHKPIFTKGKFQHNLKNIINLFPYI